MMVIDAVMLAQWKGENMRIVMSKLARWWGGQGKARATLMRWDAQYICSATRPQATSRV